MRIGATVLLNNKKSVQSYGWQYFRPLGELQNVLNSLEEYECDEIAIIRPVRKEDSIVDFKSDLLILQSISIMTPISFGGGIRSSEHLKLLKSLPIERLIFSSAFLKKNNTLIDMAIGLFGRQAIQCALPLCRIKGSVYIYNSAEAKYMPINEIDFQFIDLFANEIILIDTDNEGSSNCFDWSLLEALPFQKSRVIISGGIGIKCINQAEKNGVTSVLVDNKILHSEYSIAGYRHATNLS